MKRAIFAIVVLFIFSFRLMASEGADCSISGELNGLYIAECENYENQERLFLEDGSSLEVVEVLRGNIFVESPDEQMVIEHGEGLFFERSFSQDVAPAPSALPPQIINQYFYQDKSTEKRNFSFYYSGAGISYQKTKVNFDTVPEQVINVSDVDLETAPKSFSLEGTFENFGFILTPDFEEDGGEIVFYDPMPTFDYGVFFGINSSKNTQELLVDGRQEEFEQTKARDISLGAFLRFRSEDDDQLSLIALKAGYGNSKIGNDLGDGATMEFGFVTLDTTLYFKLSERFLMGPGAFFGFASGTYKIESNNSLLRDQLKAFELKLKPLEMLLKF